MIFGSSRHGTAEMNPNTQPHEGTMRSHEVARSIPGLPPWVEAAALLWPWWRPAAVALSQPLAWEPPCATEVALKRNGKRKKNFFIYFRCCWFIVFYQFSAVQHGDPVTHTRMDSFFSHYHAPS